MTTENIVTRGFTQIEFVDQYGDKRLIQRSRGTALRIKKKDDSVSHVLNRVSAEMMGERIKKRRVEMGMSLDDLLAKAGLAAAPGQGKSRMWAIENAGKGRHGAQLQGVRFGTLYALAIALECEPSDLMPSAKEVADRAGVGLIVPNSLRLAVA